MSTQMNMFELFNLVEEPLINKTTLDIESSTTVFSSVTDSNLKDVNEMFNTTKNNVITDLLENILIEHEQELNLNTHNVTDVRTESQKNKKISYDVGEKIWGARKDIEEFKRKFLENPDHNLLNEIAELDVVVAEELASKSNVFNWFTMEYCHEQNVEIHAAYAMYLLIRRIPTNSKGLNRSEYMKAIVFISNCFKSVKTFEQFSDLFIRFSVMITEDSQRDYRERQVIKLTTDIEVLESDKNAPSCQLLKLLTRALETKGYLYVIDDIKNEFHLDKLGAFSELLNSYKKRNTFNTSINKYSTWEEYFEANGKKTSREGIKRTSVWERELPVEPMRKGGRELEEINSPKHFKEYFGFKAVQFGLYVDDLSGRAHLVNSSRAFVDLADILNIDIEHISLGNELSMAFGARGKGRGLGHYERGYNIINLTKERGSLGILSHEWFHAYDHFLSIVLANNPGTLLTEGKELYQLPMDVYEAYDYLIQAIKEGESTAYIDVAGFKGTYRINSTFMATYKSVNGDLQAFMDNRMQRFDGQVERTLSSCVSSEYREKMMLKYERKRKKEIRSYAQALSQYHKEITGEEVTKIPYTVNQTHFYRSAIDLDRGKEGKYWSSNVELCARSFEAYINQKLKERGCLSDYLVCGIDPIAYPIGIEQTRIYDAMERFMKVTLPYLRGEK